MRHTTLFPVEIRDLVIGIVALFLAAMIWAFLMAPIAI